ncbi:MAG: site-2 protease family protein [Clostridia bacterium]|jgi:stage IV sporulation protein FB|nr:site-2 protease family protein [Clostridia bacterium]
MVKFKFHPLLLVFACAFIYYGYGLLLLNYLVVLFIHELAHAYIASKLGYTLKNVTLLPYGVALDGSTADFKVKDEIKIAVAGPLINIIIGVIFLAGWWLVPEIYSYTADFVFANFVTAGFNLLPAFPLDGGRILLAMFSAKFARKKAYKFVRIISIIFALLFAVWFAVSIILLNSINYTIITACIFMFCGVLYKDKTSVYTRNMYSDKQKLLKMGMNVRSVAVDSTVRLYALNRILHSGYYNTIYVLDYNLKLKKILYEHELEQIFLNNTSDTEIGEVVNAL